MAQPSQLQLFPGTLYLELEKKEPLTASDNANGLVSQMPGAALIVAFCSVE